MLPPSDPEALLDALDPEQRQVATALTGPVAVIAGAGTGKTRAITHRIAYGVRTGAYAPTSVLAVTFTTRAAGELRGRLQQLGVSGVQARTFHSAALRQAQYFWPRAFGGELPQVLDNRMSLVAEAAGRLRVSVDTAKLRDLVGEISWAKVSNVAAADYPAIARSVGRELASLEPETVARVFAGYEEAKRTRGRIDFEDILLCTTALLADHPQVADEIRRTYRHLVVDEYQDVSPLQQRLLDLWLGERGEVCVVGDPAQTIHSFAGARADYLTGFGRRHPDATVVRLVRDYRSTPQVVRTANAIMSRAPRNGGMGPVTLEAQRAAGPETTFAAAPDEASEAAAVADWLKSLRALGIEYREMAVLFRINAQSPAFEQALSDRDIPYLVRGAERFYERPEVRQAMGVLRTATKVTEDNQPVPDQVRAILTGIGWTTEAPSGGGQARERWESLAALASVADDLVTADAYTTLDAVVDELERRAAAQHAPVAQGVTLGTIHSAKGLEWDAVAVIGVHEGTLPFVLATRDEEIAEERRLLYVAVTRAREHLRVSWSHSRNGGGGHRNASRFLDGVRPAGSDPRPVRSTRQQRRRGSQLSARCRVCDGTLESAVERKLGRHEGCESSYDEELLAALKSWRSDQAKEQQLPAYCIFTDATLQAIAETNPGDERGLLAISGIGRTKVDRYGDEVLRIVQESADS
ncbi:ATP-dependent DNA helicase UvrD2 [Enemella evansiae]|uniref:ATP-dependent DNA helicase UvrD2 n=1 Tax=Enemella evansiae TaxID=2016499 RepID=UPI001E34DBED|nr:ATP-dependent DNA helicase UvrD2 [Enemella evansiae]